MPRADRHAYWGIIRRDAVQFLSVHSGYGSELYHDQVHPSLGQDLVRGLRSTIGGGLQLLRGFAWSCLRTRSGGSASEDKYLLLITPGGSKYAGEEREIVQECRARGIATRTVYVIESTGGSMDSGALSVRTLLTPGDYARVWLSWVLEVATGLHWYASRDRKARSLFAASIFGLRQHHTKVAFARRILLEYGKACAVLSLAPTSAASVTIVEFMKTEGVATAGIRTQTTSAHQEHLAINTDVLFCKSIPEKRIYESVLRGQGPRLEDGCLLSLPDTYALEPLVLPDKYVLLLGTTPHYGQDNAESEDFFATLWCVATAARLPVVFKGHPAEGYGGGRLGGLSLEGEECLVVTDVRRNRELIDRSALIVAAPSTLLYYAILRGIPVVIAEARRSGALEDEFATAPMRRVGHDQATALGLLQWEDLRDSAVRARAWFEKNYFLNKDAGYLVDYLLSDHVPGERRARNDVTDGPPA
jgi:hypothetical protein